MGFPGTPTCQTILDSVADGVFTVDRDFTVTFFNASAGRITGMDPREAVGRKCWDVLRSSLCEGGCALRESLEREARVMDASVFIVDSQGERRPVSIASAPLYDAAGELVGGVETFRDLSELHQLRRQVRQAEDAVFSFEDLVSKSPAMQRIFGILPQIAQSEANVLLLGESGTGKELLAKAIHTASDRGDGPFVAVNCGALPDTLLESELFGYKAGAFTDARKDKPGRFELAQGGSILLDEIGEMSPALQVKLLRVLQDKRFTPLGGVEPRETDARIIAATNRDLAGEVEAGRFRRDLYYRLNVVCLRLPPLRERPEDVPLLVHHVVERLRVATGKQIEGVSEEVMGLLLRQPYPGNVRELENILEYAFILCPEGLIRREHLPEHYQPPHAHNDAAAEPAAGLPAGLTLAELKCRAARQALARHQGRTMRACRELGIAKDTLRRILARCPERQREQPGTPKGA